RPRVRGLTAPGSRNPGVSPRTRGTVPKNRSMSEVPAHDDSSRAQPRLPSRNVTYQPPEVPMGCRRVVFGCLGVLVAWSAAGPAPGQTAPAVPPWGPAEPPPAFGPAPVALEEVPPAARARVRAVIEQPT